MSWIKMRAGLRSDPAVLCMARALKIERDLIVGKLHALWSWADENTETGDFPGLTADVIDEIVGVPGFCEAMAATKPTAWLVIKPDGIAIPKYDRHNGQSAKRRAMDAERKASARHADKMRTESGPEERRGEESIPPKAPRERGAFGNGRRAAAQQAWKMVADAISSTGDFEARQGKVGPAIAAVVAKAGGFQALASMTAYEAEKAFARTFRANGHAP